MFPGQLPPVRKDIHNVIVPVDLSDPTDPEMVTEMITSLIKREVPVRWGIVPVVTTPISEQHARVSYHLYDSYGLSALMNYFGSVSVPSSLYRQRQH